MVRQNSFVEAYNYVKQMDSIRENKIQQQLNESIQRHKEEIDRINNIRDSREIRRRNHSKLLEDCKNDALSTVIKAIYIEALSPESLTDNGIILAESLVDSWIKNKGGASRVIAENRNKTYLLNRLCNIAEEAALREAEEIEGMENENSGDNAEAPTPADAKKAKVTELMAQAQALIAKATAIQNGQEIDDSDDLDSEDTSDSVSADDMSADDASADDNAESSEEPEENTEEEDTSDDNSESESDEDEEETDFDADLDTDDDEEESDDDDEDDDDFDTNEDEEDDEDLDSEDNDESNDDLDSEDTSDEDVDLDAEDDTEAEDTSGDAEGEENTSDANAESEEDTNDDDMDDLDNDGESDEDEDNDVDSVDGGEDIEDDGSEDGSDITDLDSEEPVSVNGEDEEGNPGEKGKIFDELEEEEDVKKAVQIISQRVADAEEDFVKRNAEDKKKIDDLIGKISDNIKTVEKISDNDSAESKVAEESVRMYNRQIKNITENRPQKVFEKMVRKLTESAVKDPVLKESYTLDDGKLDIGGIIESAKVMYGFLEALNTLQLERVDKEYVMNVIKDL